jgi:hypothetical protein
LKKIGCFLDSCEGKLFVGGAVMVVGGAGVTYGGGVLVRNLAAASAGEGGLAGLELLHGVAAGGSMSAGGVLLSAFGGLAIYDACAGTIHRFDKR